MNLQMSARKKNVVFASNLLPITSEQCAFSLVVMHGHAETAIRTFLALKNVQIAELKFRKLLFYSINCRNYKAANYSL